MCADSQYVEITNYLDFHDRSQQYWNSFNNKSFPYQLPKIIYLGSFVPATINSSNPEVYICIPIKNQGENIYQILSALFDSVETTFTAGIVLDNCTDNTKQEVLRFLTEKARNHRRLTRFDLLSSNGELFETTCENLLFQFCEEKYFMSLQADIYMTDNTFIERALKAFDQNSNLLGISGRAIVGFDREQKNAHRNAWRVLTNLPNRIAPRIWKHKYLGSAHSRTGYFGDISRYPVSSMRFSARQLRSCYPGQAIIRGPIIWRSEYFEQLGGFDDLGYFLGRDDCDLSLRGWLQFKYFVAYLPCRSYSKPLEGTTRKQRTSDANVELQKRTQLSVRHKGVLNSFWDQELVLNLNLMPKRKIRIK